MKLTLVVIRSAVPEQLAEFYKIFGLAFEYHRHGNTPYHYSAKVGDTLLEIYPLAKSQEKADTSLRLGFSIPFFDTVISTLADRGVVFHQTATKTEWGIMAVIADPEARKIELYKDG